MAKPSKKILIILAFFAIYVIWGSTYLLNKIAVSEIPPMYLAGIRFSIAGLLMLIISKILKLELRITKRQFINSFVAGFLFLVYGNGIFVWALKYIDSGFAALEASTQPLFVLILMRLIDGKEIRRKSIIGIALGIIGMYLLVSQNSIITNSDSIIGILMILTCVLAWSYASVFVSKADLPSSFFVSTTYQMLISGVLLFIVSSLINEVWVAPATWSASVSISMVFLILLGSIVAFTAFNFLLKEVSTDKVSTSAFVNPVVALFLGWWILDERMSLQSIIATILLLTGVYFITSKKS